jgi:Protein of unknown function (DUF3168)
VIDEGLWSLLSTSAQVSSLCGTRIYPEVRPTDAKLPLIEMKEISGIGRQTWDTSGMQRDRYQFDCYAKTKGAAVVLRDAVRQVLNGYRGRLSDGTFLDNAWVINRVSGFQDDPRIYISTIEFYVLYNFTN